MKQKLFARLRDFIKRKDEGASMVEYALMVALIAVACLGAVTAIGVDLSGLFTALDGSVQTATGS